MIANQVGWGDHGGGRDLMIAHQRIIQLHKPVLAETGHTNVRFCAGQEEFGL